MDAKDENDLKRRDALLDELRALARAHGEDAAVRWALAMGLFNTLVDAKSEDDLLRRDTLLEQMRALAARYPDHEWLQDAWQGAAHMMSVED